MTKEKNIIETIDAILGKWAIWVSIIFLFLPGILYQLYFMNANMSDYNGLSIILFLAVSFYFSLPFILVGIVRVRLMEDPRDAEEYMLFGIGIETILVYFFSSIVAMFKNLSFWIAFLYVSIFLLGIGAASHYINKKVRLKNK